MPQLTSPGLPATSLRTVTCRTRPSSYPGEPVGIDSYNREPPKMRDERAISVVRDVLAGDQDGQPRRARRMFCHVAPIRIMLKIAGLLPRRPHLPK
jgi:hypothetical protein